MSGRLTCSSNVLDTDAFSLAGSAWTLLRATWLLARKTLAALEAMLAMFMCLLSTMAPVGLAAGSGDFPIVDWLLVPVGLACPVLCFSCLMLTVKFVSDGSQALLENAYEWWCGVAGGVVLVMTGFASMAAVSLELSNADVLQRLALFTCGAPLLIPSAHLLIEALVARYSRGDI